jgi:hypothetical protein
MNTLDGTRRCADFGPRACRAAPRRRGSTLVEVQVSLIILCIGIMGLCSLVVVQLRQVRVLEKQLQGQVVETHRSTGTTTTMLTANTYYLVPWQNGLAQKLTGAAQIFTSATNACDPGSLTVPKSATPSPVTVVELDLPVSSQEVMVFIPGQSPTLQQQQPSNPGITAYVNVTAP